MNGISNLLKIFSGEKVLGEFFRRSYFKSSNPMNFNSRTSIKLSQMVASSKSILRRGITNQCGGGTPTREANCGAPRLHLKMQPIPASRILKLNKISLTASCQMTSSASKWTDLTSRETRWCSQKHHI